MDNETMKPLSMPDSHRLTQLRKEKQELDRTIRNLYLQYIHNEINPETYHERYRKAYDERIKIIQQMKDIRG